MAIETVNYYGIGWSQIHVLNIIQPLTLPFEGILELHTGFYDTQVCSFPVTIPDSTLTQIRETSAKEIKIYPNPADDFISLENKQAQNINQLLISDLNGRLIIELNKLKTTEVNVEYLKPGLYFVRILKEEGETFQSKFIKQ